MRSTLILIALGAVFITMAMFLLSVGLRKGDSFPVHSSLRADPRGTRLLFEALGETPGFSVTRSFEDPRRIDVRDHAVFFIGVNPLSLMLDTTVVSRLRALAAAGNRVVVSIDGPYERKPGAVADAGKSNSMDSLAATDSSSPAPARPFNLYIGSAEGDSPSTGVEDERGLQWGTGLSLVGDSSWKPLMRTGAIVRVAEKSLGKGTMVVMADSYNLSNQGIRRNSRVLGTNPLIPMLLGERTQVVFDEWHLGIVRQTGIVGLVKRFELTPVLLVGVVWFLLFIWASKGAQAGETAVERRSSAALTLGNPLHSLVASHVKPRDLLMSCRKVWDETNPGLRQLPEPSGTTLTERYNSIYHKLHHKHRNPGDGT